MAKGDVPFFMVVIIGLVIILFLAVSLLILFNTEQGDTIKCALNLFRFTGGCPT